MTGPAPAQDAEEVVAADPLADEGVADRVMRGGAVRLLGFGLSNVVAAASSIVLLHHLSVPEFGRYGTVMALMTIISGLTDGGLNIAGTRELALLPAGAGRRSLTGVILGIRLVLTVIGVGLAVAFAALVGYDSTMVLGTLVAGAGIVGLSAVSALTLPLNVELRNVRLTLVELAKQLVQLVGTVAFVLAGAGLLAFFGVQAGVGLVVLALLPLLAGMGAMVAPRYDRAEWRHIVVVALPVALAGVLAILYLRILIVIGSLVLGDEELGLLVTSARVIEVLSGLPLLVVSVALPVVSVAARDNPERLRYVAQKLLEVSAMLGGLTALALSFGAHPAVVLLGGQKFADAAPVLAVQAWVMVTVFVIQSCVILLVALHRQADIVRGNLIGLAAVLVAGLVLLPLGGAGGGAIAALVADGVLMVTMLVLLRRAGLGRELTWGVVPRIGLAGVLGTAAGLIPGLPDLLSAVVACATFGVALVVLRATPPELTRLVAQRLGRAA